MTRHTPLDKLSHNSSDKGIESFETHQEVAPHPTVAERQLGEALRWTTQHPQAEN